MSTAVARLVVALRHVAIRTFGNTPDTSYGISFPRIKTNSAMKRVLRVLLFSREPCKWDNAAVGHATWLRQKGSIMGLCVSRLGD